LKFVRPAVTAPGEDDRRDTEGTEIEKRKAISATLQAIFFFVAEQFQD
jgi:hypothetical protein